MDRNRLYTLRSGTRQYHFVPRDDRPAIVVHELQDVGRLLATWHTDWPSATQAQRGGEFAPPQLTWHDTPFPYASGDDMLAHWKRTLARTL